jgi:hypothetical protein
MPFTVATRETLKEMILQASRRLSHSRRPHVVRELRKRVFWMGIARSRRGHPQIREHWEYERLFDPMVDRAWN